eukprot:jgi/Orpsp1_1/1183324/evm.model.c7180000084711.2
MLNDTQNLSQLVPGTFTSCYGIIIDFTYPKSTKKKDFYQIVSLIDPYSNFKVVKLLIFLPNYNSFPDIKEKGDIIFCNSVKVEKHSDKIQIISNINSKFSVFPKIKLYIKSKNENSIIDNYRKWYKENESYINTNIIFQKPTSSYKLKISQLKQDTRYFDIYAQLIRIFNTGSYNYTTVLITDYTENELLDEKIYHENPNIHARIYLQCIFW